MTIPNHSKPKLNVFVLMGGSSSERDISLSTGRMILSALDPARYAAIGVDTRDFLCAALPAAPEAAAQRSLLAPRADEEDAGTAIAPTAEALQPGADRRRPDLVLIALHGKGGEDGTIQGMLEVLGLPYTGSGVLASALAMDKAMSKRLFKSASVPVIPDITIRRGEALSKAEICQQIEATLGGFPVFVKPNAEGSTFGCTLVSSPEEILPAIEEALRLDSIALVERYVRGVEITVGVLGNTGEELQALPIIEIVPKAAYYDFESKYADGGSEHIIPGRLFASETLRAQNLAKACHEALGCRGMSRTDMIMEDDTLYVLETNTIPGMTPTSLLPQAAAAAGISFSALLDRLIDLALGKNHVPPVT